ncbi:ATPase, T2SS/T4P/T4SS family [Desulfothermus sp.]
MSWDGYLKWLETQKIKLQRHLNKNRIWEAKDIAETTLFSLVRTWDFAKKLNQTQTLSAYKTFFQNVLSDLDMEDNRVLQSIFNDKQSQSDASFDAVKSFIKQGEYQKAIEKINSVFNDGILDFEYVKLMIFCLEKTGDLDKLVNFLTNVLVERDSFEKKQLAYIYFKLGSTLLRLNKTTQAREYFWKLKKLYPSYPGLEEKLEEIEKRRIRSKSRYELLIEQGCITEEQLKEAKEIALKENKDLDEILLNKFNVPKKKLGESLSSFYDVPFVEFNPKVLPPYSIFEKRKLDPNFLKQYEWVPYKEQGNTIQVLMTNPFDLSRLDEIKFILGTNQIEPLVSTKNDIEEFIDHFFKALTSENELLEFDEEIEEDIHEDFDELEKEITEQDSEIVRLVNAILVEAWRKNASDIHIEPNTISKYCLIRMRVDGTCHEFKKLRLHYARPIVSRIKIMARLDIAERRLPQDGKLKIRLPNMNKIVEYRVATLPTIDNQEDVVLRVLASGKPIPVDKLGLLPHNLEIFKENITQPYGMILVVGPTGSGKTTTLHSALGYINKPDKKIWTAEDPVEITQEGLRQVQINPKIGLTFASALRAFLRADPDVIMIGEMRDKETAHIGIEASLTGHLVFSTLHTNSAPETVTRLLDMDLDPFNFSDSLLCILAQRLIKTLCNECKEPYRPTNKEIDELRKEFGEHDWDKWVKDDEITLYRARGCANCMGGYKGRMGIHELLKNSDAIRSLIKKRVPTEEIKKVAISEGMLTLKQDGILKVLRGYTDIHQVRAVAGKS